MRIPATSARVVSMKACAAAMLATVAFAACTAPGSSADDPQAATDESSPIQVGPPKSNPCLAGASDVTVPWTSTARQSSGTTAYAQTACGAFIVDMQRSGAAPLVQVSGIAELDTDLSPIATQAECELTHLEFQLWAFAPACPGQVPVEMASIGAAPTVRCTTPTDPTSEFKIRANFSGTGRWSTAHADHPAGVCDLSVAPDVQFQSEAATTAVRGVARAYTIGADRADGGVLTPRVVRIGL